MDDDLVEQDGGEGLEEVKQPCFEEKLAGEDSSWELIEHTGDWGMVWAKKSLLLDEELVPRDYEFEVFIDRPNGILPQDEVG